MADHALLSASSAHRWMNCTPSARIASAFPNETSAYAEAGTLAHSIAELKARKYFLEPMGKKEYTSRLSALQQNPIYDSGMDAATDVYLEHLQHLAMTHFDDKPFVSLETKVDFSEYVPDGFGTADCLMFGGCVLCVTDYKNGSGVPVSAEGNVQMMLYALGALQTFQWIFGDTIQTCHLSIVQPNDGGVKEWDINVSSLKTWAREVLKPVAEQAWKGEGECNPGPWCRSAFCPARDVCRARLSQLAAAAHELHEMEVPGKKLDAVMSDEEIADLLIRVRDLTQTVKDLEAYTLKRLLAGKTMPGWKLVAGKSTREWDGGADAAFPKLIERGVDEALLWSRTAITAPQLDKALGKKTFEEVSKGLVKSTPGKPCLALASDKRKPYVPEKVSAKDAFKDIAATAN